MYAIQVENMMFQSRLYQIPKEDAKKRTEI